MHLHVFVLKSILSFSYFLGYINRHLHSTRADLYRHSINSYWYDILIQCQQR